MAKGLEEETQTQKEGEKKMGYLTLIMNLFPAIIKLMGIVEDALGSGTGATKKKIVMGAAKIIMTVIIALSGGGQKDWWEKSQEKISSMIDTLAGLIFPKDGD